MLTKSDMQSSTRRYAVASKEGLAISEHFGHAKQFFIYEVNADKCQLIEQRQVSNYCLGQTADQSAMKGILAAVSDCQAVFVAKIGDGPREKLRKQSVIAVDEYAWEGIESSLRQFWLKQ